MNKISGGLTGLGALKHLASATCLDYERMISYEFLVKLLTPPTADEVCRALEEYYVDIYSKWKDETRDTIESVCEYHEKWKTFSMYVTNSKKTFSTSISLLVALDQYGNMNTHDFPPKLLIMLARFYENNAKKEEK